MRDEILERMFREQQAFSDLFFDRDKLTDAEKERLTLVFSASLQKEVASLLEGVNYREHRPGRREISKSTILYESVDVFRYLLATLSLWGFDARDFQEAYTDRGSYLTLRHALDQNVWSGQPVLIVDLDDVIVDFKNGFADWLDYEYDLKVNRQGAEYYFSKELVAAGHTPDGLYRVFIEARGLRELGAKPGAAELINRFHEQGYWIHLLTSRHHDNRLCRYDTFRWLAEEGLKFHKIDFSPEKYLWLSKTAYLREGKVVCAIDDSSKHCQEYVKHGVRVACPRMSYNTELEGVEGIYRYDSVDELESIVLKLTPPKVVPGR